MSTVTEIVIQNSNDTEALTEIQIQQEPVCMPTLVTECTIQLACSENNESLYHQDKRLPEHSSDEKNSNAKGKQPPQNIELNSAETTALSFPLLVNEYSQSSNKLTSDTDFSQKIASTTIPSDMHSDAYFCKQNANEKTSIEFYQKFHQNFTRNDLYLPERSLNQNNSNSLISEGKQPPQCTEFYCADTTTQSYSLQKVNHFSTPSSSEPSITDMLQEIASGITFKEYHQDQVCLPYQETDFDVQFSPLSESQFISGPFLHSNHSSYENSTNTWESRGIHQEQQIGSSETAETFCYKSCSSQNEALELLNSILPSIFDLSQHKTSYELFTGRQQEKIPNLPNDGQLEPVNHLEVLQNKLELILAGSYVPSSSKCAVEFENRASSLPFQSEETYSNQNLFPFKNNDQNPNLMSGCRKGSCIIQKRRSYSYFTEEQTEKLQQVYDKYEYLTKEESSKLARDLGVKDGKVSTWFADRRQKYPKQTKQGRDKKIEELYLRRGVYPPDEDIESFCQEEGLSDKDVRSLLHGIHMKYSQFKRKIFENKKDV